MSVQLVGAVVGYLGLNTIAAYTLDAEGSAVHLEVLTCVYAVVHSREDVDGAGFFLYLEVLLGRYAVLHVACDVECSATCHLEVPLAIYGTFLSVVGRGIGQGVGGSVGQFEVDTLATHYVECFLEGRLQVEAVEAYGALVVRYEDEAAARAFAVEHVDVFGACTVIFGEHVLALDGECDIGCRRANGGRVGAVPCDVDDGVGGLVEVFELDVLYVGHCISVAAWEEY